MEFLARLGHVICIHCGGIASSRSSRMRLKIWHFYRESKAMIGVVVDD